ncbi:hypothetical protein WR25_06152 [Diploscapter pachys]|uniref:Uncharacterized protein n=1 Tax=Diploscapter pachys TaxID=2018661 RepID=A0A2A2KQI7_9BILA|nr:hypothetical protein WR25_06152 [Diploscapter pachys]
MEGNFTVEGSTETLGDLPMLALLHDCGDGMKKGQRKMRFKIPISYWTKDGEEPKIFPFGEFNLEAKIKSNEERVDEVDKFRFRRNVPENSKTPNSTEKSRLDKYKEPDDRSDPW